MKILFLLLVSACVSGSGTSDPLPVDWGHRYTCTVTTSPGCPVPASQHTECLTDEADAEQPIFDACDENACACLDITCDRDFFPCVLTSR